MTKAQRALAATRELAETAPDWIRLKNSLYGPTGVISELFPTEAAPIHSIGIV